MSHGEAAERRVKERDEEGASTEKRGERCGKGTSSQNRYTTSSWPATAALRVSVLCYPLQKQNLDERVKLACEIDQHRLRKESFIVI